MHLAPRIFERLIDFLHAPLLGVDERMGITVEHVMREHAQSEGAANLGIVLAQMRHPVAQRRELLGDATAMHGLGEPHALGDMRCAHAEEEWIRALVCQQKRHAFIIASDNSRW